MGFKHLIRALADSQADHAGKLVIQCR